MSQVDDVYDEFLDHVRQYNYVGDAAGLLHWDQQVVMPDDGIGARSKQNSTLSTLHHDMLVDDNLADWLDTLEDRDLDDDQQAVVREVRREHDRARKVPRDLVERISETTSEALPVWEQAKAEADFAAFEDDLAEIVSLRREYAEEIDPDRDPYAVLFEEYEPYLPLDTAERVLERLAEELPPMIDAIADSDVDLADPFDGTYPEDDQERLVRAALDDVGYDWDRGRLDPAPHPFSMGTPYDARVTTRYDESDPLNQALTSTIHEFGHASYTLGLPEEHYGTPLGASRDLTVHESQSRFWENHVARSRAFWEFFAPQIDEHLGVDVSPRRLSEAANRVYEDNLIRVEADELTYHLHVVLRFEIERDLIRGDLDVEEVPGVWNDKMEDYLGIRPDDDGDGCLQDIHWAQGSVGYFPTYSLGSMFGAQLAASLEEDLDRADLVREGEFGPILDWHREHVHRHGCRYTTPDLIEEATGESLTADYFLDYAESKFGDLYNL
ncbi:MAG: carboxypeptidase M32 [Haloarculaceae archaeon]